MFKSVWFQNLNKDGYERKRRLNVRGCIGRSWDDVWLKYQVATGPAFKFNIERDDEGPGVDVVLGLFFITFYLTFEKLRLPFLKPGREYGFYIFEWRLWVFCGRSKWESRHDDPWYYKVVVDFPKLLFGDTVYFEKDRGLKNGQPVLFEFRSKQYEMNEIEVSEGHWFRERIPMALYCQRVMRMHLKIEKPPGFAGKGENDYDCGDDASYGLTCPYDGPPPNWQYRDAVFEYCCRVYCENVSKSIKKRGRASGDDVPADVVDFKYLGVKPLDGPNGPGSGVAGNVRGSN